MLFELFIGSVFLLLCFAEGKSGRLTAYVFGLFAAASFYSAWQFHRGRREPFVHLGKSILWGLVLAALVMVPLVIWVATQGLCDTL